MPETTKVTAAERRAADRRKRQTEALRANLKRRKAAADVTQDSQDGESTPETE